MVPPFERLIDEYGAVVMRVCRALLGPADADDAWSETFLSALKAYPGLKDHTNLRGWLVTIAHHKAIDQLRVKRRIPVPSDSLPDRVAADDAPAPDPELWGALGALAFKQKAAVAYHYLAGLPYAEVGDLIGSSEVAARRAAADGIANLRKSYVRGKAS
jgi:RNA polymerase sigma factor (sigma-70 family)